MNLPVNYQPTEQELEILQILWEHQPATVRFVFEAISKKREVGYTHILRQMQRLAEKKILSRTLQGKTHLYSVIPQKEEMQSNLFKRFVNNVYQGSSMKMIMHALGQGHATQEEIEALQKWLEEQKKQRDE